MLSKAKINEELKEDMVYQATSGRTTSIREMMTGEAVKMIKHLRGEQDDWVADDRKQRMKRQILALCHEMNWEHDNGKVDMDRVNRYCQSRGYLKKGFDEYTTKELPKLITQFKQMHKNYLQNA